VNVAVQPTLLSVKQYLAEEETSRVRHEYVRGYVYAMAGASNAHNEICLNVAELLRAHLRGGQCRTSMADVKLRPHFDEEIFYYPDLMVTCDPRDKHPLFNRFPKLILEVTSESTEMLDRREKLLEYLRIETLEEYVLIAQDRIEATVFRRSNDWKPQIIRDSNGELSLESLNLTAKMSAIYAGVVF
jgi:Uma2 family endonuclease